MTRKLALATLAAAISVLLPSPSSAQSILKFDVADVHVEPNYPDIEYGPSSAVRAGKYEFRHASLVDMISNAWGLTPDKVLGGPSWLEIRKFNVIAKFPDGTKDDTLKLMLRSLLAERFGLVVHNDSRPMPAFMLTAEKKPVLKQSAPSDDDAPGACKNETPPATSVAPGETAPVPLFTIACRNITMARFTELVGKTPAVNQYVGVNAIVDQTGLQGAWDFSYQYNNRNLAATRGVPVVTLAEAMEKLGLKLAAGTAPALVLVVDSANEKPTANTPEAIKSLQQTPTEFEVAEFRPTDPSVTTARYQLQPGGRLSIRRWPLFWYIEDAWNFEDDDRVIGPKFMKDDYWDLVAKAPAGIAGAGAGTSLDYETVHAMVRTLLVDRFKLVAHLEDRPVSGWTLTALKPKMKKADPAERTKCTDGPANLASTDPRNGNPIVGRLVTCQNASMAYLSERLQYLAGGYVHSDVLDSTGLEGGWDFTLSFSTSGQVRGATSAPSDGPPGSGGIAAPNGAISLSEAIDKQLGLKLEQQKRPMPVLVVDHIEQKPTEN